MPIRRIVRDVAPYRDWYDWIFAVVLGIIILAGFGSFVWISPLGLSAAWAVFIKNSGLLVLLTAWTAMIGLYRLRHRQDKIRPSVREDFENLNGEEPTDFGLRNFGPGPALYVQAAATVEQEKEEEVPSGLSNRLSRFLQEKEETEPDPVTDSQVHDSPIHLREGEFLSLVLDAEEDWVNDMAEKYEIGQPDGDTDCEQENPHMVNLYYSYVSQSGVRTPEDISCEREDSDVLDEIVEPNAEARRIELCRVVDAC